MLLRLQALDEEVGALRAQLQERLERVEGDVRQTVEQLDLHAQVCSAGPLLRVGYG